MKQKNNTGSKTLKLLIPVMVFMLSLAVAHADLTLRWTFDDTDLANATAINDFAGEDNNVGHLQGGVLSGQNGLLGESFFFDGSDDYVNTVDPGSVGGNFTKEIRPELANAFSMSFWVNMTAQEADRTFQAQWDSNSQRVFRIGTENPAPSTSVRVDISANPGGPSTAIIGTTPITAGDWVHVGVVYDGSLTGANIVRIWLNGTEIPDNGATAPSPISNADSEHRAGQFDDPPIRFFDGYMDEVCYWNQSICTLGGSCQNMTDLYNSGAGLNCNDIFGTGPIIGPPTVNLLYPTESLVTSNDPVDVNFTYSVDPLTTLSGVQIWINDTFNKTVTTNTTIDVSDGVYRLRINLTDNENQSVQDSIDNFRVDRTNPFDNLLTQIPPATDIYQSQNITISAFNVNLSTHNVTVYDSLNNQVISIEDQNIHANENQITLNIDLAVLGVDSYTVVTNESDVIGNELQTSSSFNIVAPTASNIQCDVAGFNSCAGGEGDTLAQVRSTCSFSDSATFTISNPGVVDSGPGVQAGSIFTFDNADQLLTEGEQYNVSVVCTSEIGTSQLDSIWSVTAASVEQGEQLSNSVAWGSALGKIVIILAVLAAIAGAIGVSTIGFGSKRTGGRRSMGKRGGRRK